MALIATRSLPFCSFVTRLCLEMPGGFSMKVIVCVWVLMEVEGRRKRCSCLRFVLSGADRHRLWLSAPLVRYPGYASLGFGSQRLLQQRSMAPAPEELGSGGSPPSSGRPREAPVPCRGWSVPGVGVRPHTLRHQVRGTQQPKQVAR